MSPNKNRRIIFYIVFLVIGFICYSYYYIQKNRDGLKKDWNNIRCQPHIIPFAGLIGNENTYTNFMYCYFGWIKHFFKVFTQPIIYIFKILNKNFTNILLIINNFRKQAKIIRSLFKKFVLSTAERIQKSHVVIQFYKAKLRDVLRKQQALFLVYRYFGQAQMITVRSLVNGPLPQLFSFLKTNKTHFKWLMDTCTTCVKSLSKKATVKQRAKGAYACPGCLGGAIASPFVCFDENTNIKMLNGQHKIIKNINLNDNISKGGKVLSIMKFNINKFQNSDMYDYKGVYVTGNHIVFENGVPLKVKESEYSFKIDYKKDYIYCLISENNLIETDNDILFSDYLECNDPETSLKNDRLILENLNNTKPIEYNDDINHLYNWGIEDDTEIYMNDGSLKKIKYVEPGDIIYNNSYVYGKIINNDHNIQIFYYKGIRMTGSQLVLEENTWIRCHQSKYSIPIQVKSKTMNLFVLGNEIILKDGIKIRDYYEIPSFHFVFDKIYENNIKYLKRGL